MKVIVILCDTLRRDHCEPYTNGEPLNTCWSQEAPDWSVPTPSMMRIAQRGTTFDNAYCGSSPCMPARRDLYTGNYEFLHRGWGPLEDDDVDLPRTISGNPNESIQLTLRNKYTLSYLVTDHFHLWEQGSGNYHMGYSGFDFIRGAEADAWYTNPIDTFPIPETERHEKIERHWRNVHHIRQSEEDWFAAQVFQNAADWLEANHELDDFYLHIDCFDPHEPWDPPEDILKVFDPNGYDVEGWTSSPPYDKWREHMNDEQFNSFRARYAAKVILTDRWLGYFLDTMDRLNLWDDTLVIFTTDHGTYNGDHGRLGKLQVHQHDAVSHIPFIVAHPTLAQGERRDQFVQIVDIFPTVLSALGKEIPDNIQGIDLLPVLEDSTSTTRDYAISGVFGTSISLTDGDWVLHQSPNSSNEPLYWYGHRLSMFPPVSYQLGDYHEMRREVIPPDWSTETWLSNKRDDPNELINLADTHPRKLLELQRKLIDVLQTLNAPEEQFQRLGLSELI